MKTIKKLQKTFIVFLILLVSGAINVGAALAYELVATPEFTANAEGGVLNVKPGEEVGFKINLSADIHQRQTSGTLSVDTQYNLNANNTFSSSKPSNSISFGGSNNFKHQVNAKLFVSKDAKPGTFNIPVKVDITNTGTGAGNNLNNDTVDFITVKVLSNDTPPPVVKITNPADGGYYKTSDLPAQPEFDVVEENSYTTAVTNYSTAEGTHTVTVTATDNAGNKGSDSVTYTVDNTAPVIGSQLVDGGVYNAEAIEALGEKYYSIEEPNLKDSTASALSTKEGAHKAVITAVDKAGNSAEKTINYIVDNTVPTITFKFDDGGFYTSEAFKKFDPYYVVEDDNLDTVTPDKAELKEGSHTVKVSATDLAGNKNSASAGYTIDDTAPEVNIYLEEGKYYNAEALSNVGEFYSVHDTNLLETVAEGFGTKDGAHNASVNATDKAGNETTKSVSYVVDTKSPVITIKEDKLANGGFYQSSYLENLDKFFTVEDDNLADVEVSDLNLKDGNHTFTITAFDKAGNKSTESVSYTVDNEAPTISFNLEANGFYKSENLPENYFTASDNNEVVSVVSDELNKEEGTHTLEVTAVDAAGNSTTRTITYTVDATAPIVTITAPEDGGFYQSANLPDEVQFDVEETHAYTTNVLNWNTETEGEHTVTVVATDAAGNTGQASVTYTVDNIKPVISSLLVDGGVYNAETLKELGQYYEVTDLNLVEESVSASELQLEEGNYTAVITAEDKAGNKAKKEINYTVDNTAPEITFTFKDEKHYTSEDFEELAPWYHVSDNHLVKESVKATGLSFKEGNHEVTVSAKDLAGNSNTQSASYTLDDTAPVVTVSLEEGKYYNLDALEALGQYWNASDENLADVTASPLATEDGTHTATVTAVDFAGNETTVSVEYHVDNTPPVIVIDGDKLANGGFYNAEYLQNLEDVYSIVDANPHTDSATDFIFTEGTHEFTVTAVDKAGNEAEKTISYTVDNTPPAIEFNLTNGGVYSADTLKELGSYYSVTDNHDGVTVDASGLITDKDGTYTLEVTATDKAGNSTTRSVTYTVDNTAPEVSFNLTQGGHYTSAALTKALEGHDGYFNASDKHLTEVNADELKTSEGKHTVTVIAEDAAGNTTTKSLTYVVDNTAPVIHGVKGLKDGQRFIVGQDVSLQPEVTDNLDANPVVKAAEKLDTSKAGSFTYSVSAQDKAGNSSSLDLNYEVYSYSGVLNPVKADGSSAFKRNSTVPVKFEISNGTEYITDAAATLHLNKLSDKEGGELIEADSTSAASTGNFFRNSGNQYIFNLGTRNLNEGEYKGTITIELDGTKSAQEFYFNIRK